MVKSGSVARKHKSNEFEQASPPKKIKKNSFSVLDTQDGPSMNSKKTKNSQAFGLENKNNRPSILVSTYNPQQKKKKEEKLNLKRKAQGEEEINEISQPKLSKKQKQKLKKKENVTFHENKNVGQLEHSQVKEKKSKINLVIDDSAISNKNKSTDVSTSQGQIKLTKNQKRKLNKKRKFQAEKSGSSETSSPAQKSSPEKTSKINLLTKSRSRRLRRNKGKVGQVTNGIVNNVPLIKGTPKDRKKLLNQREETERSNESMTENKKVDTNKQKKKSNKTIIKQKEQIEDSDDSESEDEKPDDSESEDEKPDDSESEDEKPDDSESEDEELGEEDDNEVEVVNKNTKKSRSAEENLSSDEGDESSQEESEAGESSQEESEAGESSQEGSDAGESSQEDSDENVDVKDLLDMEAVEGKETSEDESSDDGNTKKVINSSAEHVFKSSDDDDDDDDERTSNKYITKKNFDQIKQKPFEREQYPTSSTKVVLKDLPENVTEEMIRETFSFVGDIKSITIPWDRNQDKPKQFAFMELADKDSAQKVVELSRIAKVGDSTIFIKEYVEFPAGSRGRGGSQGGGFRGSRGGGGGFRGSPGGGGGFRGGFRGSPGRGGGFRGSRGGDRDFRGRGGFRGSRGGEGGGFRGSRGGEGGGFRGSRGRGGDRRSSESVTGFRGSKRGGGGKI